MTWFACEDRASYEQTRAPFFQTGLRGSNKEVAWASCPCLARLPTLPGGPRLSRKLFRTSAFQCRIKWVGTGSVDAILGSNAGCAIRGLRLLCFAENCLAMPRKKRGFGRGSIIWKAQRLSGICAKILGDATLRQLGFESWREKEPELVVEGHKPPIKSGIVQARKTKAVADIQSFGDMSSPRQDV